MLKVNECSRNILGDREVLNNVADYIKQNVGSQDWSDHVHEISGYVAAGICWNEYEVRGYLNSLLSK